jgi:hypothetical protein
MFSPRKSALPPAARYRNPPLVVAVHATPVTLSSNTFGASNDSPPPVALDAQLVNFESFTLAYSEALKLIAGPFVIDAKVETSTNRHCHFPVVSTITVVPPDTSRQPLSGVGPGVAGSGVCVARGDPVFSGV